MLSDLFTQPVLVFVTTSRARSNIPNWLRVCDSWFTAHTKLRVDRATFPDLFLHDAMRLITQCRKQHDVRAKKSVLLDWYIFAMALHIFLLENRKLLSQYYCNSFENYWKLITKLISQEECAQPYHFLFGTATFSIKKHARQKMMLCW